MFEQMGRTPNAYAYSSYDGVWLAGLTIMEVQTTDVDMVKLALPGVAAEYTGAIGKTVLNDAGDLAGADYEIWTTENGEWIKVAKYVAETGEIVGMGEPNIVMDEMETPMSTSNPDEAP